jgi:SNF2 family DNA or RNA helicase
LIVAPTSVLSNWQRELRRFAPSLSYCLWHGSERTNHKSAFLSADVVITSYALLHLDSDFLLAQQYTMVVLDEAQFIKNPRTKVSQAARQLVAEQRLCLSGTPVENHLGELWSLFDFVQPGLLGSEAQFSRLYRKPIEIQGSSYRSEILAKRLAPFILRRTKNQVAKDLPAKSEFIQTLTMGDAQRELYDSLRLSMHKQLRQLIAAQGVSGSHIEILDTLLKLRQVCCDPRLLAPSGNAQNGEVQKSDASNSDSVKMRFLVEQIPALIEEGRRILLFSQFTSVLTLVGQAMDAIEVPYLQLTGSTRNRQALVDRFQSGEIPLFLISLKAGGTGLNLTAADTVIHYDPWWNPAVEDQATDRAHRIGQDKPVFVYKLVTENTVEEKILALHARKRSLAEGIYTNKAASSMSIGVEDLEFLMQ